MGIIRSAYASPLHVVPKKNNEIRSHGHFRWFNEKTVHDRYPIENLADFSSKLADTKIFSNIDLVRGYYQIPVAESDIPKTAIINYFRQKHGKCWR